MCGRSRSRIGHPDTMLIHIPRPLWAHTLPPTLHRPTLIPTLRRCSGEKWTIGMYTRGRISAISALAGERAHAADSDRIGGGLAKLATAGRNPKNAS
eukprot:8674203-Pyramimonas_sp.AAC.1